MSFYDKIYKLEKEENYEEFVEGFGLPEDRKSFLLNYKPNQKFLKDGDTYTHVAYIGDLEKPIEFQLGEEFESTIRTTNVKNLYTIEDDVVTHLLKLGLDGEIVITVKKEFTEDTMEETITSNVHDITAKRYYSV